MTIIVAHVSDLHLGAHDPAAVEALVADVAAARPTLTVVTGDCTMRSRPAELTAAHRLLSRLPSPQLVVAGNHDRRGLSFPEPGPVVRRDGITVLGLNSTPWWRWKNARVSRRQADAVSNVLGAQSGIRVLAMHHPPLSSGGVRLLGRGRLLRALTRAGVTLALAGHTHVPSIRRQGGLVEVVAGTATSRRTRGVPNSWSLITLAPGGIEVRERWFVDGRWRTGRAVRLRDRR